MGTRDDEYDYLFKGKKLHIASKNVNFKLIIIFVVINCMGILITCFKMSYLMANLASYMFLPSLVFHKRRLGILLSIFKLLVLVEIGVTLFNLLVVIL